jgi:hypothetical protein
MLQSYAIIVTELRPELDLSSVSRPFPSWNRFILAEIYLGHACSGHEILRAETAGPQMSYRLRRVRHRNEQLQKLKTFLVRPHRPVIESSWLPLASECQRVGHPPRLNHPPVWTAAGGPAPGGHDLAPGAAELDVARRAAQAADPTGRHARRVGVAGRGPGDTQPGVRRG